MLLPRSRILRVGRVVVLVSAILLTTSVRGVGWVLRIAATVGSATRVRLLAVVGWVARVTGVVGIGRIVAILSLALRLTSLRRRYARAGHVLRCTHIDTLVANVIRHPNLDVGQETLHLLLDILLDEEPTGPFELSMAAVDNREHALAETLLHLPDEIADLVDKLGFEIVSEASRLGARRVKGVVERITAEQFLQRSLDLVG